jgi:hypothetical protein
MSLSRYKPVNCQSGSQIKPTDDPQRVTSGKANSKSTYIMSSDLSLDS